MRSPERVRAASVTAARVAEGGDLDKHLAGSGPSPLDRKSTRLNSSHANISYAVFCLKKKKNFPDTTVFNPDLASIDSKLFFEPRTFPGYRAAPLPPYTARMSPTISDSPGQPGRSPGC